MVGLFRIVFSINCFAFSILVFLAILIASCINMGIIFANCFSSSDSNIFLELIAKPLGSLKIGHETILIESCN